MSTTATLRSLVVSLVAATASASLAPAQAPPIGTPVRVHLTYRDPLAPLDSDYVWDAPAGAPTLSGALIAWSDSALLLQRDATRQWRIRLTRVESVVIPSGQGSRARSALVLGTVGAAAGPLAVLFYSARRFMNSDPDPVHAPIRSYQLGAWIGAGVGSIIGALRPGTRWAQVFPR